MSNDGRGVCVAPSSVRPTAHTLPLPLRPLSAPTPPAPVPAPTSPAAAGTAGPGSKKNKQDRVSDPELFFAGEEATADDGSGGEDENAFLRTVVVTMNCSTPNATLRYTTDGSSVPTDASPSVPPGTSVQWSEEGATEFRVVAVADGLYESELTKWPVTILAPRIDEHPVAGSSWSSSSSSSSLSSGGNETSGTPA